MNQKTEKLKIALVSKLWEQTSPLSTGGTGLSVGILAEELIKKGHEVTLFATGDSKTNAHLVSVLDNPWKNNYSEVIEYLHIAQAFSPKNDFDIIHCHIEHKASYFAELSKTKSLLTLRYGEFFDDEKKLLDKYKNLNWSFNSHALEKLFPNLNSFGVVHNGLDLERFPFSNKQDGFLFFLSRLSPQKQPHVAIEIAKKTGKKLILAGKMTIQDEEYLNQKVRPYIDNEQIVYIGEIGFEEKIKYLTKALCVLHPNSCFEACSNTILEAQACGTPVIAYDNGSNKELIIEGKTGFIVKTIEDAIEKISTIEKINRQECRSHMEKEFSADKMTDGYIALYNKIINK